MIRIIIDQHDGQFTLDVLDTRNPVGVNVTRHADYVDVAVAAAKALATWHGPDAHPYGVMPGSGQPDDDLDEVPILPRWHTAITLAAAGALLWLVLSLI